MNKVMLHVTQNEGHVRAYGHEHYCIQQCIYLSISLERWTMHGKLGELEKTKFRPMMEVVKRRRNNSEKKPCFGI